MADIKFWDTERILPKCIECGKTATVNVVDPDGKSHGPYCGVDADAIVNSENLPLRQAQNPKWKPNAKA